MTMTDPVADMLTRIRNGNMAYHDTVVMPTSTLKEALARVLTKEGYVERYEVRDRVGKPGLRVYRQADRLPRVLGGLGVAVLSTSQGLMTDREARERRVGGEVLCYVW